MVDYKLMQKLYINFPYKYELAILYTKIAFDYSKSEVISR